MIVARQSTARTFTIGPVLDASGAAVTDSVVGDFKIAKNGGAPGALNGSATLTHRHTGNYSLALTASDLDTVGSAEITCDDTVNACAVKEITVIEEAVYDELFAASALGYIANAPVDIQTIKGNAVVNGGTITFPTNATLASTENITSASGITVATNNDKTGYQLSAGGIGDVADAIWDEGSAGHSTGGTYGYLVSQIWLSNVAAIGTVDSTGATASSFRTDLTAVDDFYNDMLLTFTSGALSGQTKPIASYVQTNGLFTFDEAFTAAPANGVTFQVVKTHVHPVSQIASGVWSSATRTLTAIDEDSTTLDLDATVRAAVGLASANLDTQLDALPTAAENSTEIWGAETRTLTALDEDSTTLDVDATIRAAVGLASANLDTQLDALPTTAEVRTQCDDALTAINLDHLVKSAVDTNFATTVHLDSVIGQLADNGTTATFDRTTDSLEAVRDRGDSAWITATGFSTLDAAGVRSAVGLASANIDTQFSDLDGKVSIIQAVAEQLDDTLEDQGGGTYGFTAAALQEAPTGGSAPTVEEIADEVQTRTIAAVTSVTNRVTANVDQLGGSAQSLTDLKDFADAGYDPATNKVQGVVLVDTTTTNTDMRGTDNAALASVLGAAVGSSISADIAAVKSDTASLLTRVTANIFSGITYLKNWLGALAGKTADTATRAEINATTAGAGYNETTDSLEARADAAIDVTLDEEDIDDIADAVIVGLAGSSVEVRSPVLQPDLLELVQGNDYLDTDGRAIQFTISGISPDYTAGSCVLYLRKGDVTLDITGSITTATGPTRVLEFEMTAEETASLPDGVGRFEVEVTLANTHVLSPAIGKLRVLEQIEMEP